MSNMYAPTPLACHLSAVTVSVELGGLLKETVREETTAPCAERKPRSKATGRVSRARSASPCPFTNRPSPEQMEPFQMYEEDEKEWEKWKAWNDPGPVSKGSINHCSQHCKHPACRTTAHHDKERRLAQRACECDSQPVWKDDASDDKRVPHLTSKSIANAQCVYKSASKDTFITIGLNSSTSLIESFQDMGALDIRSYLRRHGDFKPSILYHRSDYSASTRSANHFIDKLHLYLQTTLSPLPDQTRKVSIVELEREIKEAMRMELFWWMSEWCFPNSLRKWDDERTKAAKLAAGYSHARKQWVDGKLNEGVEALLQRAEEVIEMVVSVLVWWSQCEEQVSCEMADQIEEDDQMERCSSWSYSSGSSNSDDLDESSDSD